MKNIKINFESLPARCEICHQLDCFDPKVNRCSRCEDIMDDELSCTKKEKLSLSSINLGLVYGAVFGAIIGLLSELAKSHINRLENHFYSIESSCWVIFGLAFLGTVWGAIVSEGIKQIRNRIQK